LAKAAVSFDAYLQLYQVMTKPAYNYRYTQVLSTMDCGAKKDVLVFLD
jgi:hypothetical protein